MKSAKSVVIAMFVLFGFWSVSRTCWGDGSVQPGLINPSNGGGQYFYPIGQAPVGGGVLVSNANGVFAWSGGVVQSTTAATINSLPILSMLTAAQLGQLTPTATGQLVICNGCTNANVCVSSGTTQGAWATIASSATTPNKGTCN